MHHKTIIIAAGITLATALAGGPAQAMSARTFVSPTGNDLNPCSLAAPCRNFQAALTQTNPGGEIAVLGTAGYGGDAPFVINKAVSIVNEGGYEAGIAVQPGMAGIVINAGATDAISLRGLTIDGNGVGAFGIQFNSGKSLTIKDCVVRHTAGNGAPNENGSGIYFAPSASSNLFVSDTVVSDNGDIGIYVFPSGSGTVLAVFNHVEANNNRFGIALDGFNSTATIKGTAADSVASNNTSAGFFVESGAAPATLTVFHSVAANNGTFGLQAANTVATLRVANSVVTGNTTSWTEQASAKVRSYGDNYIDGNGDGDPTPTAIVRK